MRGKGIWCVAFHRRKHRAVKFACYAKPGRRLHFGAGVLLWPWHHKNAVCNHLLLHYVKYHNNKINLSLKKYYRYYFNKKKASI